MGLIVLSNSLPKSGSTLLRNFTTELVRLRFGAQGADALHQLGAAGRLPLVGGFLPRPSPEHLDVLSGEDVAAPMVVKIHAALNDDLRRRIGPCCRVTYTIRDPRDVYLSARDHALRTAQTAKPMFGRFLHEDSALAALGPMLDTAIEWLQSGLAHVVRYEALVGDPAGTLARLAAFIDLEASGDEIEAIVAAERHRRAPGRNNFNTGAVDRYRSEMDTGFRERFESVLGPRMRALGYVPASDG